MQHCVSEFRKVCKEVSLRDDNRYTDAQMLRIMDLVKPRLRFLKDLHKHAYFFARPEYESDQKRFFKKLQKDLK